MVLVISSIGNLAEMLSNAIFILALFLSWLWRPQTYFTTFEQSLSFPTICG